MESAKDNDMTELEREIQGLVVFPGGIEDCEKYIGSALEFVQVPWRRRDPTVDLVVNSSSRVFASYEQVGPFLEEGMVAIVNARRTVPRLEGRIVPYGVVLPGDGDGPTRGYFGLPVRRSGSGQ